MAAYNSSYTGVQIDTAVGAVVTAQAAGGIVNVNGINTTLGDYLTSSDASSTYLTQSDASSIYLTQTDAASTYLPLTGGALTGALTFANNTLNNIGDDVAIGDVNQAGALGIKGLNGTTNLRFIQYNATAAGTLSWDGSKFAFSSWLNITANSNTVSIGSQNNGWCHIYNSASIPFIFNNSVACAGTLNDTTASLGYGSYPFHRLILGGATNATMTADSTNPRITFEENTGTQPVHLIYCDWDNYRAPAGLKIIGGASATPAWLEVEGAVYGRSWNATSSREIKHAIINLDDMGTILDELNPVSFIYNDDPFNQERYGLIYEDTVNICPIICSENGQFKTINYIDLIPVLIKEIQSLRKRIKLLENN